VRYFLINILNEDFHSCKKNNGDFQTKNSIFTCVEKCWTPIATAVGLAFAASFGGAIILEAVLIGRAWETLL
jgi:ABC-type dipeptide/oligopeptide/nickel transport system permease component